MKGLLKNFYLFICVVFPIPLVLLFINIFYAHSLSVRNTLTHTFLYNVLKTKQNKAKHQKRKIQHEIENGI